MNRIPGLLAALLVASAPGFSQAAPGDVDTTFDPQVNSHPFGIGIQPDTSIVLGGWFSRIGGAPRSGLGRILVDGRLDNAFNPAANDQVFCTAVQPDGRILVAGEFTQVNNVYHVRIARLNANGSPDPRFETHASQAVYSVTPLEDGKTLIAGNFNAVNGVDRRKVARLNADGSLDSSFVDPQLNAQVWTVAVQPDGKYLLGGSFDTVAGQAQTRVARLNADGTHDRSFGDPNMEGSVHGIFVQADGAIIIGGSFTKVDGVTRNRIARLRSNGTLDSRYAPNLDDRVDSMAPQADGKLIITGPFTRVDGEVRVYTARLHSDGSLDDSFVANGKNANRNILSSALQADGRLLIGGNFSEINGVRHPTFARLLNDPATEELTVPTGDRVQWMRGGSSPELGRVWFEHSTNNGASWTPLAGGTRITGGWEATGLALAGDGLVRARGIYSSGRFNGSSSLLESEAPFSFPPPDATTLAASGITSTGATLRGEVNANGTSTAVSFEYGLTVAYGTTLAAVPASLGGDMAAPVTAALDGLPPETTYHFRVTATNPSGTTSGDDMVFTTLSENARLAGLVPNDGTLVPGFDSLGTNYLATVSFDTSVVTLTPTTEHPGASVMIAGAPVASGSASGMIALAVGNRVVETVGTAEDGITTQAYTIAFTRLPREFVFSSATDVVVRAAGFAADGLTATPVLNYPPVPGTTLTMVDNTGLGFIRGTFVNLSQGQRVPLDYGGGTYEFVVTYFGGTGNDLVLQWADTTVFAWGANKYGQLGDASTSGHLRPTPIGQSGVLAGKTIVAVSNGYLHSLALCADGTLAAWGYNAYGQLGNGGSEPSTVPVAVDRSGALAGKTAIAISAGPFHNLALCADGSIVAWGYNNYGQLGTGDRATARVPVAVNPAGALAGKQVTAVAAAKYHSLALCGDGTVAAWGFNDEGALGDGTTTSSLLPVAVRADGALAGRQVSSLAAGQDHTLALCTDGTLVAWGYGNRGQLGNGGTGSATEPVTINGGALAGKTVVAVCAGGSHSLALCSDGSLASWGGNIHGELGVDGIAESRTPVAVSMPDETPGGPPARIALGRSHSLALDADGVLTAWGDNSEGQLGDNGTTSRSVPAVVDTSTAAGARIMCMAGGSANLHNLAVAAYSAAPAPARALSQPRAEIPIASIVSEDADGDGIPALIEYAFGLNPIENSAGQLPQGRLTGDQYVLVFTQPEDVVGIRYGAEWSATLLPGSWTAVSDTGTGREHRFSVPTRDTPRVFVRLTATAE